jgi:hypothetical protein
MSHLSPESLLDRAEGTRAASAERHLESCERCRRQLADLEAAMALAAEADVPEPSPLFWDHLSARVREAIDGEPVPRRSRLTAPAWLTGLVGPGGWSWPMVSSVSAVAVAALALAVGLHILPPRGVEAPAPVAAARIDARADRPAGASFEPLGDDPGYAVVSDLAVDLDVDLGTDMDAAVQAGLVAGDSAEHAVAHLDAGELRELQRLLSEQLARGRVS